MSKHAVVVEDGQRTKRMGRRLKVGAGIFGGMMAIGTGVAVAAWLVTGSGTGSIGTQSIQNLTLDVDGVGGYFPGATGQAMVRVNNPNGYDVPLTSATAVSDSACYTVSIDPLPQGAVVVAYAHIGYHPNLGGRYVDDRFTFLMNVAMPATAGPECANTTFTPTVTVNGKVGQ
jgi:hypothetical protein